MAGIAESHVVVTGAAGGVGQAVCKWLTDEGAHVYALDIRANDDVVGQFVQADVTDPESIGAAVEQVRSAGGRIDGLIAAAGVSEEPTPFEDMPLAVWNRTLGVNLLGIFNTCQAVGRVMLEQGAGRIVNIGSMSGNHVVNKPQQQAAYNASKAAVVALTKSIAVEWAPRGVRVNALSPGYISTPLLASKSDMHAIWTAATPLGRMATTFEAAAAAGWLLSDEAAFCIGTELLMDGGYSLW